jgi:galactokinase/mevalonate kinase-like predicted kinase
VSEQLDRNLTPQEKARTETLKFNQDNRMPPKQELRPATSHSDALLYINKVQKMVEIHEEMNERLQQVIEKQQAEIKELVFSLKDILHDEQLQSGGSLHFADYKKAWELLKRNSGEVRK